jgi:hypothetical protein
MRIIVSLLAFTAMTSLVVNVGHAAGPATAGYTELDDTARQLRADFNRAKGSVRLLFVVDPICPGCLRGMDDLNEALLAKTRDARLNTFVVYVPVLDPPPKAKDVMPAAALLDNPNVRHYWNPSGSFGRILGDSLSLESNGKSVYAWDVWLIYGPEVEWSEGPPPKPLLLMHQLRALQGSKEFPHLERETFAREVRELLAKLPKESLSP